MKRDDEQTGGIGRWLTLGLIALGVVTLIIMIVMMISGDEHGPARHFSLAQPWAIAGQGV